MGAAAIKRFCRDADALRRRFPRPLDLRRWAFGGAPDEGAICTFCIIELNDLWAFFCRSMILDLATGRAVDFSGNRIPIAGRPAAYETALTTVRSKRGYEPKWHSAAESIAAVDKLGLPLGDQVKLALGVTSSPAPEVNTVRNYLAHRRSDCAVKLRDARFYDRRMELDPYRVGNFLRSDGQSLFDYWVKELSLIAFACLA